MPKYEILDTKTGKKVTIEADKPPAEGDFEGIFKDAGLRNGGRKATGVSGSGEANWLGKLVFPRGAEIQRKQLMGENVSADERLGGVGEATNRVAAPFFGPLGLLAGGMAEGATQPGASAEDRTKNAVIQGGLQYGGAKLIEKLAPVLGNILKNPTKGVAGRNLRAATDKATQEGAKIGWHQGENNLIDQITSEIKKKLVWNNEVRDATNNLLSNLTKVPDTVPGQNGLPMIGDGAYSAIDLLNTRGQVTKTIGSKIFDAMTGRGGGVDDKVYSITRNVISKNLHRLAPDTLGPDKMLAIYNKFGLLGKFGAPGIVGGAIAGKYATGKATDLLKLLGAGGQ